MNTNLFNGVFVLPALLIESSVEGVDDQKAVTHSQFSCDYCC